MVYRSFQMDKQTISILACRIVSLRHIKPSYRWRMTRTNEKQTTSVTRLRGPAKKPTHLCDSCWFRLGTDHTQTNPHRKPKHLLTPLLCLCNQPRFRSRQPFIATCENLLTTALFHRPRLRTPQGELGPPLLTLPLRSTSVASRSREGLSGCVNIGTHPVDRGVFWRPCLVAGAGCLCVWPRVSAAVTGH